MNSWCEGGKNKMYFGRQRDCEFKVDFYLNQSIFNSFSINHLIILVIRIIKTFICEVSQEHKQKQTRKTI